MLTLEARITYARNVAQATREAERVGTASDRVAVKAALAHYSETLKHEDLVALGDTALTVIERNKP